MFYSETKATSDGSIFTAVNLPRFLGGNRITELRLPRKKRQKNHFAGVLPYSALSHFLSSMALSFIADRIVDWMRQRSRSPVGTLRTTRRATAALALL